MAKRRRRGRGFGAPDGEHVVGAEKAMRKVLRKMGTSCDRVALIEVAAEYGRALAHTESVSDTISRRELSNTLRDLGDGVEAHARNCQRNRS